MAEVLLGIGLLIFISLSFTAAFRKTLVPDVLLWILLGNPPGAIGPGTGDTCALVVMIALFGRFQLGMNWFMNVLLVFPIAESLKMREPAMTVLVLETGLIDLPSFDIVFSLLDSPAGVKAAP